MKTLNMLGLVAALTFGAFTVSQAADSCCKPEKKECCAKGGECCKK